MKAKFFRQAYTLATLPLDRSFRLALQNPARAQDSLRRRLQRMAASTEYGRSLGVSGNETYHQFTERVPVVDYDGFKCWMERQYQVGGRIVCSRSPRLFEKTSGSSGKSKHIPYTPALLRTFRRYVALWARDLWLNGPNFSTGKIFMSLSPPFKDEGQSPTGVPVSFDDDTEYLSPLARRLVGNRFVIPGGINRLADATDYRMVLAFHLLAERDLEIISVWSPTYLLSLLGFIVDKRERLADDLQRGVTQAGDRSFPLSRSAKIQATILRETTNWLDLFPRLKFISCWTDGNSSPFIPSLKRSFPGVMIQGKGLLATECPMTLPMLRYDAPVPFLTDVFMEFERNGTIYRLHELEDKAEYKIIVSQLGGLMRYRMHDVVKVDGSAYGTPCFRFCGREGNVSDMVGEKLSESFVRDLLSPHLERGGFSFIVPVQREDELPYYCCVTDGPVDRWSALERQLQRAFHYRQARLLGQLAPLRVLHEPRARERFSEIMEHRGQKAGAVKYSALLAPSMTKECSGLSELRKADDVYNVGCRRPQGLGGRSVHQ